MKEHFAKLKGSVISQVHTDPEARDVLSLGLVRLAAAVNWLDRPSLNHHPHLIAGAVVWQDNRTPEDVRAAKWTEVRATRDGILRASDWRVIHAADRGGQAQSDWAKGPWRDYRQALRDLTNQSDPFGIVWPTAPVV